MTAPAPSPAARPPAGLAVVVMSLSLGLAVAPPAHAEARARVPATSLRLALDVSEIQLRLGVPDLRLRLGALPDDGLRLGRFDLGSPLVGIRVGTRHVDLALAVGSQLAPDGRVGMSLAAQLRLGTRDGVGVTASYGYRLPPESTSGRRLLPHGAISIPLGPRLSITGEGSLLGEGGALGTLGLGYRLDAGGAPWFLSGGLGFTFRRAEPDCPGGAQLRVNADWCAEPAVVFGIQRRF
jgi:hypothetical protein